MRMPLLLYELLLRSAAVIRITAIVLCLGVLLGGCSLFVEPTPLVVGPNGETATPTRNATQLAIMVMMTQTRGAPTTTNTPVVTPTFTPTPTATTPPLGSSERPVSIGQQAAASGAAMTVLSARVLDAKAASAGGKFKAADGAAYLDVEAIIENTSDGNMDYAPLLFRLADAQGNTYQPLTGGIWPPLQSGTLRKGEWVRGHITFQITPPADGAGLGGLRLRYSPELAAGNTVDLWVNLSQPPAQAKLPETPAVSDMEALPVTGKRDESGGAALSVSQVSASDRIGPTKAGAGNVLVSLMVTIENVSRPKTPFNPDYFAVKDEQGYEYPAVIIPSESVLGAGSLVQGQKVSGQVVFEVPASVTRLVVEYQPQVLVDEYPVIRFLVEVPKK